MAEYVLGHVLSIYHNHRFFAQTQKDQQWRPSRHSEELNGKKMAIIGLGQIGLQIAKTFSFFGVKVDGFNRSDVDSIYIQQRYPLNELKDRLSQYDIVVVSLALNQNTLMMINREIMAQLNPKAIFVNIFGGIMKCDTIAQGIINASQQVKIDVPVVVRLTGTNADKAFTLLDDFSKKNNNVKLIVNPSFDSAAQAVIEQAAKKV
jgi:hypothetical protein